VVVSYIFLLLCLCNYSKIPVSAVVEMQSIDEIVAGLSNKMAVSENNVHDQHPRFCDYKNEGKISESQRARRISHLERQTKFVLTIIIIYLFINMF
jgi:hypothetical protein